jgi:type II secretory pathway pseudopilin PulG
MTCRALKVIHRAAAEDCRAAPPGPKLAKPRSARSFTLIETLATLALAAIVLPLAMHGVTLSLRTATSARQQSEAAQLAELKLNELLVMRDTLQLNSYGDFGDNWPQYRWQTNSVHWGDALYEVTVTVQWEDRGRERDLSLATLVYTSGLAPDAEVEP